MTREIPYEVWDVFTEAPFGGNPLAILPDARGLDAPTMQAIAREFGFSETVFMLPPEAGGTIRLRIFTPRSEIPFAGHPTIGAATSLARAGHAFGRPVPPNPVIEEGIGAIACRTTCENGHWRARFTSLAAFERGGSFPLGAIAACLGLPDAALTERRHPAIMASKGLPFVCVEAANAEAVSAAIPVRDAFAATRDTHVPPPGFFGIALYHRASETAARLRVFAPLDGIDEDPATGSAAAALAALLCDTTGAPVTLDITQGVEMGRPSRIAASADAPEPGSSRVTIGGSAVPVMTGRLSL